MHVGNQSAVHRVDDKIQHRGTDHIAAAEIYGEKEKCKHDKQDGRQISQ